MCPGRRACFVLTEISGSLREFTGECDLGFLYPSSLVVLVVEPHGEVGRVQRLAPVPQLVGGLRQALCLCVFKCVAVLLVVFVVSLMYVLLFH